ncbi:TSC complex subunit 1b isoform X1 [Syngnathus scovelli]|uniref:TSC complex subunit 1b isoform X1 n=1 Tax=Syngnathus scovelli TaxID=161590 RepID=UPI002110C366|nr:TSC complex subunit 1b isoform X1 [Syngnathus scovelli]
MAREQPSTGDLLPLLETSDLHQLEEIRGLINEQLSTERGSVLLNGLVDYFLETNSPEAMHILCAVREPHDKHLLDKMNECMTKQACRLPTLTMLGHVIRKQPSWIHKIARYPLLLSLLKCLKTDTDVVVLITGVLVLITLLPMIPQAGKQHLWEYFDIFGRLASWNLKNPGHISEVYLIHLHASVYSLFHRLYGMYPCNFVSYLRSHYSMKENMETFEEVVKPMLEHVRIHPELVTGTKDHELDPTRWKKYEIHDIVIECAKVSLDPKEASCEEGYATMPENFYPQVHLRPQDCTSSPYTDLYSSYGSSSSTPFSTPRQPLPPPLSLPPLSGTQSNNRSPQTTKRQNSTCEANASNGGKDPLWSPSSLCGMATPPSSRGMSPNLELSHSASHLPSRFHCTSGGKGTSASSTPATSSPPPTLSDDFPIISLPANTVHSSPPRKERRHGDGGKPILVRQEPVKDSEKSGATNRDAADAASVSMTLTELSVFMKKQELELQLRTEKEKEEAAITEELLKITEDKQELSGLRGFDSPFYRTTETLTGCQTQDKIVTNSQVGGAILDLRHAVSTPDKAENNTSASDVGSEQGGGDSRSSTGGLNQSWPFLSGFTPIDHHLHRSPSAPEDEAGKFAMFSPSPCGKTPAPVPYEVFFDLALPRAASLYIHQKTSEAVHKAALERLSRREEGLEDGEEEGLMTASPLEVLDRLVQQGSDTHDKVLKSLPLPSKSADWTHFGGSAPSDELHTLRSQLLLLHNQLLYERYKREQHAVRNRRLLRRIINATALEEQNNAMKDQLNLQSVDITSLRESLQVEQQRYRQLWDDRETVVTRLHSQIRQLQQGRDDYYTKNQELQSKLQECQKRMGELEAELQGANNKVCHTGHLLKQMTIKLRNSEGTQQQMSFLNKQLLLLGEAHKLSMQELKFAGAANTKRPSSHEAQMLQVSHRKEVETLRQNLLVQGQKLEAAHQRAAELETLLSKKEHLIAEQKKFLEDVKCQAKAELQASDSRYQAQKRIAQLLQTEILQLYSKVEMEVPASLPPGLKADRHAPADSSSILVPDGPSKTRTNEEMDGRPARDSHCDNGSTLLAGHLKASKSSKSTANSVNGSKECGPSLMADRPLSCPRTNPLAMLTPSDAPLTVGSYPSDKSYIGIRSRELFRNKSESQCGEEEEEDEQPSKAEPCAEPPGPGARLSLAPAPTATPSPAAPPARPAKTSSESKQQVPGHESPRRKIGRGSLGTGRPRQQQLKIMDYNETHHEHS